MYSFADSMTQTKPSETIVHHFESGRRGKPDELETQIAVKTAGRLLAIDPFSRFDIRVSGRWSGNDNRPVINFSGEVSDFLLDYDLPGILGPVAAGHYNAVNRTSLGLEDFSWSFNFKPQAGQLAGNASAGGDQEHAIAVAYAKFPARLPIERYISVGLRDLIDNIYQKDGEVPKELASASGISGLPGLRSDGKIGVNAAYNGSLKGIELVTAAVAHEKFLPVSEIREKLSRIMQAYIDQVAQQSGLDLGTPSIYINGLGDWNVGGWQDDEGTREAKPYRDTFSTRGVAVDSLSGEDPSKPSGTATFLARYVAVQVVSRQWADFARVALTYLIGDDNPKSVNITTDGTGVVGQAGIEFFVRDNIPLGLSNAIKVFGLRDPELYTRIAAASDFFHDQTLPWNSTGLLQSRIEYLPK